ncbi:MAG TPA: UMP kinase [Gammaproteobacteria bacterium]|nr:UMP kinase [Gammaproteobacteria bacterium]
MKSPIYKRILLKLSGEALRGSTPFGIDPQVLKTFSDELFAIYSLGVQVGIVIGGGNLFRGKSLSQYGLCRVSSDYMGMLATVMNSLAMRDVFERNGLPTRVMSAIPMSGVVDHYDRRKAIHHLEKGRVVVFAAGTGNPLVTTDSAASLRAIEIDADVLLKATQVDGIYEDDPRTNPEAKKYHHISFDEVLDKELGVMDLSAFCQCRDHRLKVRVFNIHRQHALTRIVNGEDEGTLVDTEGGKHD